MPRYFFDLTDKGIVARDRVGIDLADDEAARDHVGTLLPDLARITLPDGDLHTFVCTVRDDRGNEVYHAELTYHGRRTRAQKP